MEMSDSYHYYSCKPNAHPKRLKSVTTPSQARGKAHVYPSVTSVLGLLPNPFMAQWRGRKMVELSKLHPDATAEELEKLAWGTRTCPETGEEIGSAEFGTKAHATIEDYFTTDLIGSLAKHPYWSSVAETVSYLLDNFTFHHAEKVLCCHDLQIAGTVDYIGTDKDGKWMLADFKFRSVKPGAKPTPYDKDRAQLAVEAEMWQDDLALDYAPDIYSIIVDVDTGKPHVTKHSEKMRRKGLQLAKVASYAYWNLPGYGWAENN